MAYRNALSIRPDPDFKNDIVRLKSDISKIVKKPFNDKNLFVFLSIVSLLIGSYFIIKNRNLDKKDKTQNHLKTPNEVILKPEKLLASVQNSEQKKIAEKNSAQEISVKKVNKYNLRAIVKDPKDPWVWLRKKPISTKSTEFLKIPIGSIINTYKQSENKKWWLVKTRKGEIGYMHTSRFDLIKEN